MTKTSNYYGFADRERTYLMYKDSYRLLLDDEEQEVLDDFYHLLKDLPTDLLKDIDVSICDVINQRDEDWYE